MEVRLVLAPDPLLCKVKRKEEGGSGNLKQIYRNVYIFVCM